MHGQLLQLEFNKLPFGYIIRDIFEGLVFFVVVRGILF